MSEYLPNRYRCEIIPRRGERIARVTDLETGQRAVSKIVLTSSHALQKCIDKLEQICPDE